MPLLEVVKVGRESVRLYSVTNRGNPFFRLVYFWSGEWTSKLIRDYGTENDKKNARGAAREIAIAISQGRADQVPNINNRLRVLQAAEDALSGLNVSVDAACRDYAAAKQIVGTSGTLVGAAEQFRNSLPAKLNEIEVYEAVQKYLAALKADGASIKHLQDSRSRLNRFGIAFRGQYLHEIRTSQMQSWLRGLDVAPRTRNNFAERIVALSHWAQNENHLRKDVPTEADGLKKVATTTDVHVFSLEQFRRLIYGAVEHDPRCIHYITIGTLAFVRPNEMLRMEGASVRFLHNDIEVSDAQAKRTRKKRHRRLVPMSPSLRAWLEAYPPPDDKLVMVKTPVFVRKLVKLLNKTAKKDRAPMIEWHHDIMRNTGISIAVANTGNVDQVALWAGNSRQVIYESYLNQITPAEAAQFLGIMPPAGSAKIIRIA